MRHFDAFFLGRRPYGPILELMDHWFEARQKGQLGDVVLFVEHEAVLTGGRGAKTANILAPRELLAANGVSFFETRRGGDVTLHAPGQLVAYPILDLKPDRADVRKYVQSLTEIMRRLCADFRVASGTFPGKIGLWADAANPTHYASAEDAAQPVKLGAVGVRISRWVTSHGFALNLTTDLALFDWIVPCGISDYRVASLESLTGLRPQVAESAERASRLFADEFCAEVRFEDLSELPEHTLLSQLEHRIGTRPQL